MLNEKIEKNYERLTSPLYQINQIFQKREYDWPRDWEGRALLAFCCHYAMRKKEIPCMHEMVRALPAHTNKDLYFGVLFDGETADEQQLSGHSWYLCGLVEYYKLFKDEFALRAAKSTVEKLYLPVAAHYAKYPLDREKSGGVSGNITGVVNGWKLSSDVGCAFMCVDGLSRYYALTGDEKVKNLLDALIGVFAAIDFVQYGFQTHTTLSCTRGILTMYKKTGDGNYLSLAKGVFAKYVEKGMTLTYENFNWFGREDTWTEPCAVVDSLLLATDLYKITNREEYRTLARRIWKNGLSFCQRDNGGAGPNSCVTEKQPTLQISMFEAPFCCTMRFAEGLQCATENTFLTVDGEERVYKDEKGRYFLGDKLLAQDVDGVFSEAESVSVDGLRLIVLPTLQRDTKARLKIVF